MQSIAELVDTLNSGFTGVVVIPKDASWDLGAVTLPLHSGVSLVGERGALCARPTLFTATRDGHDQFLISANNVRVEGIHFLGPEAGNRADGQAAVFAIRVTVDRALGLGRGILIVDNEFNEWNGAGVEVKSTMVSRTPDEYDRAWSKPTRADADQVRIERNFFHHNAMDGLGYGVAVSGGAYASIVGNLFDFNRHSVASDGFAHTGYIARGNYLLEGGFMQGNYYNQLFDVHGSDVGGYGGPAGEYYEIAFNTIRAAQPYFGGAKTRPSFMLRGEPTEGAVFNANVDVHDDLDAAVSLKWHSGDWGYGENHDQFNFSAADNTFQADYSNELAAGDFDGDGKTDVFLATGTGWWISRAATEPWQLIHGSNKRTGDLAFADMDNDGVTDVVWRAPSGDLGYLKSGAGAVVLLTTSPVPVSELRLGDFDGDGRTDIFRREPNGQWMIWYGRTRIWTPAASSSFPLAELRFGDFNQTPGTDVIAVLNNEWAVSSGGTGNWAPLNGRLRPSFTNAVVADFDGDGRVDIAFDNGLQGWDFSPRGSGPLRTLREADDFIRFEPLDRLLVGKFDGAGEAGIVTYGDPYAGSLANIRNHLVIWHRGADLNHPSRSSREDMR